MSRMVSVAAVRQAEKAAVESGRSEFSLMFSAGCQAADIIHHHYPEAVRFIILCGGGNNGGDALVAAKILFQRYHKEVVICNTKPLDTLTGCAAQAAKMVPENIPVIDAKMFHTADILPGDVLIDGLLGIGFDGGALRADMKEIIAKINASRNPVVALDLPSGMNGDTGKISPDGAVNADLTITFGAVKPGLFSPEGSEFRGILRVADINLPETDNSGTEVFTNIDAVKVLPCPAVDCHKNSRGRVLVWGGSETYPGAPVLTASAALHSGSGIVRLVSCGDCRGLAPAAVIVKKIPNGSDVKSEVVPFFPLSDVLVAGCGWGNETPFEALDALWEFPGKLILDADALNMLSSRPEMWQFRSDVLITPHPGEAARLAAAFGINSTSRRELAAGLAARFKCIVLLKGRDSIIAAPDGRIGFVAAGNHALSTAGSGDVLAGIIAAQAAALPLFEAAALGAYIHGAAGEAAPGIIIADQLPRLAGKIIRSLRSNQIF